MRPQGPAKSQGMRLIKQLLLHGKRVFDMEDAKAAALQEKIPPDQLKKTLSNLAQRGHILRLRRGLYIVAGLLPEQTKPHPFAVATRLVQPSTISHWSALSYHGLTEQIPRVVTASTPNKIVTPSMRGKHPGKSQTKHAWEIAGTHYEYVTVQKKHFFGIEKIWLDEHFQIDITDKERTLLDVFIYPKMFGGIGEALGILENSLANIDVKKLIHYAVNYGKKSLAKRVGWALEYFGVPAQELEPLLKIPIHHYCRLDPSAPAKGHCDKRWMVQNNLLTK
jgi:predicted transcriptional regulator of viral defense system